MSGETFTREVCQECHNRDIGLGELPCYHCSGGYVYTRTSTPLGTEMSGENENKGVKTSGHLSEDFALLHRFANRYGRAFDGGDYSVRMAIEKIESEIVTLTSRATPPTPPETKKESSVGKLFFYEYENDLLIGAQMLKPSMPEAAERLKFLAGMMAQTKPTQPQETP